MGQEREDVPGRDLDKPAGKDADEASGVSERGRLGEPKGLFPEVVTARWLSAVLFFKSLCFEERNTELSTSPKCDVRNRV